MRKKERNMHDDIPPDEAAEFSRAFNLCCMLDEAKATGARLRAAVERTTGLEREANVRQAAEAEAEMARIEAELRGEPQQRKKTTPAAVNDAESAQTPTRRAVIIKSLGRKYPALASALDRPEEWAKACRIPKEASPDGKQGWYYLERIEAECRRRYGGAAPEPAADLSLSAQLSRISR